MADEEKSLKEAIAAITIEPVITRNDNESKQNTSSRTNYNQTNNQMGIIPNQHSNAVQFTQRPMYSSSYNPMHERRTKAIQAIYQFLEEECLYTTLAQLQKETLRVLV